MTTTSSSGSQNSQLTLVRFANPAGLQSVGGNLYLQTAASGTPESGNPGSNGFGTLQQGYLESSNVSVVQEMVNMITAQRAYEVNSKAVQSSDEMMQEANNLKK
jgi:flagellar basal-body rod protein FlgG